MESNPVLASQLNNLIARTSKIEYAGEAKSRHLLHLLVEEIGLDTIKAAVLNPIQLKVAYYGPYMQREGFCGEDDPFNPHYLEDLITALGGTPVAMMLDARVLALQVCSPTRRPHYA